MPAIVYESNTGFTYRYAEMLSEKTDYPIYHLPMAARELPEGTEVFFLGWVCGGRIEGLKVARKCFDVLACAAVGVLPPSSVVNAQLAAVNRYNGTLFYLRGGVAPEKLSKIKRKLLKMIVRQVERNPGVDRENWKLADVLRYGEDFVSGDNLGDVLAWFAALK